MDCSKTRTSRSLWVTLCAVLMLSFLSLAAFAQDQPVPKYDIFTGYQWAHPGGTVPSPFGSYNAPIGQDLPDAPWGIGAAVARNFGRFLAVEGDYGKNWTTDGKGTNEQTLSVGPRFMFRSDNANFFVHTLISWNQLSAPGLASDNGIGAILGGGIDMPLTHLITLRVIEGDYVWGRHNYASEVSSSFPDLRRPELEGLRLRTGILWNFGYPPATTPSAACSVQPSEVMVGEPITATTTASNFNPKHTLNYAWTGTGGKVTGNNNTASGVLALNWNFYGNNNTASGYQALYSNTSGNENSAFGTFALSSNTIGRENTASAATAPASMSGKSLPRMVRAGPEALRSACRTRMRR